MSVGRRIDFSNSKDVAVYPCTSGVHQQLADQSYLQWGLYVNSLVCGGLCYVAVNITFWLHCVLYQAVQNCNLQAQTCTQTQLSGESGTF
jgi:hypothetical protein